MDTARVFKVCGLRPKCSPGLESWYACEKRVLSSSLDGFMTDNLGNFLISAGVGAVLVAVWKNIQQDRWP